MQVYDIACISADKYLPDRRDYATQKEYEDEFQSRLGKQKKSDSKALLGILKSEYGTVLSIKGFYQYNKESIPSKEKSYCVVNEINDPNFKYNILDHAVEAKQNSIYYVPANTFEGYWIYTGIDLSQEDGIDKEHVYGDEDYRGLVHFGTFSTTDDGTGYSLINGRPFASYTDGIVSGDVEKVKTKNISKNITVIDENMTDETIPSVIDKHWGNYINKVRKYICTPNNLIENSNKYRRLKKSLFGDETGKIKTFAIISPENPLGWKYSTEEEFMGKYKKWLNNSAEYNKIALSNIKSEFLADKIKKTGDEILKYGHFDFVPIKGSYGDKEKTLLILNLTLPDAKAIARDYGQESFFFGIVSNTNDTPSKIAYYKTKNACQTYDLIEISDTITFEDDAIDFFSKFGMKYRINMQEFGDNVTPVINNGDFEESMNENRTFKSRAMYRKSARGNS